MRSEGIGVLGEHLQRFSFIVHRYTYDCRNTFRSTQLYRWHLGREKCVEKERGEEKTLRGLRYAATTAVENYAATASSKRA